MLKFSKSYKIYVHRETVSFFGLCLKWYCELLMSHFKKLDLQTIFTLSLHFLMWLSYLKALKNVEIKNLLK